MIFVRSISPDMISYLAWETRKGDHLGGKVGLSQILHCTRWLLEEAVNVTTLGQSIKTSYSSQGTILPAQGEK